MKRSVQLIKDEKKNTDNKNKVINSKAQCGYEKNVATGNAEKVIIPQAPRALATRKSEKSGCFIKKITCPGFPFYGPDFCRNLDKIPGIFSA